jgi:glyoxylate reductase
MKNCKVIANFAVGYNNIDVKYASSKNIIVTNTPEILTDSTADLAMTLILTCARRVREGEELVRKGKFEGWKPMMLRGMELRDKTLGIVGTGRIGTATAQRAAGFGMKIIYYDRNKNNELEENYSAKKVGLNSLLKKSDVVSVHLPLNEKTYRILNRNNLPLLKPTSIIVNTSRGEIIEEKYLIKMLQKNRIFSAGFDVYENEPNLNSELFKLKNAVLLPHLGSATIEARNRMAELAAGNIAAVLKKRSPITPV